MSWSYTWIFWCKQSVPTCPHVICTQLFTAAGSGSPRNPGFPTAAELGALVPHCHISRIFCVARAVLGCLRAELTQCRNACK